MFGKFDWSLNFTNLIALLMLVCAGFASYWGIKLLLALLRRDLDNLKENMGKRMDSMEVKLDTLGKILIDNAVRDQQIIHMQRQIDDLKNGRGFMFDIYRSAYEVTPSSSR